jgi:transposase
VDVQKKTMTACVLIRAAAGDDQQEIRRFGTMTRDLLELADWLHSSQVTPVAMESTGVYGKPVWNMLEGPFEGVLVNAQHLKAVPGRKTDITDCQGSADRLQHGWLRGSCVPPPPIRRLRDLTRVRTSLRQDQATVANRRPKILEVSVLGVRSIRARRYLDVGQ